jgi:isovaleryl-CoA dehydrogenase
MRLKFTDEQEMLRNTVRDFAEKEVAPMAYELDRDEGFPLENLKKIGKLGLIGVIIPEEYGGSGSGNYVDIAIVSEELAKVCLVTSVAYTTHASVVADNIRRNGTTEQKKKYLPSLCDATKIGGVAITEPSAGSDATSIKLRADKRGDSYVMNGTKTFITNATVGDFFLVYAKTDASKGPNGITAFVVEKGMPGFSSGKKFEKLGWRGSPTGELIFEDCIVPKTHLLGRENKGVQVLMSGLNTERIGVAAMALGLARGAFEFALKYSKDRVQFGKPISAFQMIREKLANMAMEIELSKLIVYNSAALASEIAIDDPELTSGKQVSEINLAASYAKLFTSEVVNQVTYEAIQILGGYGYIKEFPIERMWRDARLFTIGAGTSEIQRMIIATEIIK